MLALQPIVTVMPTLAVSLIYCLYNLCRVAGKQRQRRLRERVTWMLWVMANDLEWEPSASAR